jgi:xylitol oxidase
MPSTTLDARYTRLADFKQLVAKYDPQGKFRNAFLEEKLYA